ncbi:hypothetical protein BS17DRAFT_795313 [Gyrodon lividus]|nr:hypothetical protein BS17DRAFT_795313 [Gyrodon lividus]
MLSVDEEMEQCSKSLTCNASGICTALFGQPESCETVLMWAVSTTARTMCQEIEELTYPQHGLHFKRQWQQRQKTHNIDVEVQAGDREMDLGEIGGENLQERVRGNEVEERAKELSDALHNALLLVIKVIVCISIFLQSSNERCNYLQGVLGLFYHLTSVPQKVIETLAHAGLSVSIKSIENAVGSVSKEVSNHIRKAAKTLWAVFAYDNFDIDFKMLQPTLLFVSATLAMLIPLFSMPNTDVL